jgi:hypothetical protein
VVTHHAHSTAATPAQSCCSCMVAFDYNTLTSCKSASQVCVFVALDSRGGRRWLCLLSWSQRERERERERERDLHTMSCGGAY